MKMQSISQSARMLEQGLEGELEVMHLLGLWNAINQSRERSEAARAWQLRQMMETEKRRVEMVARVAAEAELAAKKAAEAMDVDPEARGNTGEDGKAGEVSHKESREQSRSGAASCSSSMVSVSNS
jgi:hypothetical protein